MDILDKRDAKDNQRYQGYFRRKKARDFLNYL